MALAQASSAFGSTPARRRPCTAARGVGRAARPWWRPQSVGVAGPSPNDTRHVAHLLWDVNPRFLQARKQDRALSHLTQHDAQRDGVAAMRAWLDFTLELDRGPQRLDMLKAALLIAHDQHMQQSLDRVDAIAAMVERHLRPGACPADLVRAINNVLFEFYGFRSAEPTRFYHPESSSLSHVLAYKRGGPTALGVLWIGVAERVGLRVAAVSLPTHFVVRPLDLGSDLYVDPFAGGALLDKPAVARLLHANLHMSAPEHLAAAAAVEAAVQDVAAPVAPAEGDEPTPTTPMLQPPRFGSGGSQPWWFEPFLAPATKVEVVMRLLRNMREVYLSPLLKRQVAEDARVAWQGSQALCVLRLMRAAEPHAEEHVINEAVLLAAMERRAEGADLLRAFLRDHPDAQGAVQTLFCMEAERRALARVAALEKEKKDAAAAAKRQSARMAGLNPNGFNGRDPNSVLDSPDFHARAIANTWNDNFWVWSMLENREEEEEDKEKGDGSGPKK